MTSHSKFKNEKVTTPDGTFDSKKEYARWIDLLWMQRAGQIKNLARQQEFILIPKQRYKGEYIKECKYVADFVYEKDGEMVVEDVKGYKTDVYKIKKKLMLWKYGVMIKET